MNWKHTVAGLAGFALGVWLCMPREILLQQRWEVRVADPAGHGLSAATVRQVRKDFTGQPQSTSRQSADADGRAAFPAVHTRSSPLLRGVFCLKWKLARGVAASCSYQQEITATVDGYVETGRDERNLPLKERGRLLRITLRPMR